MAIQYIRNIYYKTVVVKISASYIFFQTLCFLGNYKAVILHLCQFALNFISFLLKACFCKFCFKLPFFSYRFFWTSFSILIFKKTRHANICIFISLMVCCKSVPVWLLQTSSRVYTKYIKNSLQLKKILKIEQMKIKKCSLHESGIREKYLFLNYRKCLYFWKNYR